MKKNTLSVGRPKHMLVLLLLLALVVSGFLPLEVKAFDDDAHLVMKYALLREAGFGDSDALLIAQADVQVDYDRDTTASKVFGGKQARKDWHAFGTDAERVARRDVLRHRAMNQAALASESGDANEYRLALIYFGQYLHFLEDFYSHAGYGAGTGHASAGCNPDYLSSYTDVQLQSWIKEWLKDTVIFRRLLMAQAPLPPEELDNIVNGMLQSIWPTCKQIKDYNPKPQKRTFTPPQSGQAKKLVEEKYALKKCTLSVSSSLNYDKDGNVIAFVSPVEKFGLTEAEWLVYNSSIRDIIEIIVSSPLFSNHPEAGTAVTLLYESIDEMEYPDPSIHNLGCAIGNLAGLSNEDEEAMNATIDLSLSMVRLVYMRHDYATYIASLKGIRYNADFNATLFEAYGEMEKAGTEIQKMETNPHDVDFGNLTISLGNSWGYVREAEQLALAAGGVGGIVIPVDKFGSLAPYIGLASAILAATIATTIYTNSVKRRKEKH